MPPTIEGSYSVASAPRATATAPAKTTDVETAMTTTRSEPIRRPTKVVTRSVQPHIAAETRARISGFTPRC